MFRKGKNGNEIANYSYVYEANTNRLDSVINNSAQFVDYTYNAIGQMIRQEEGRSKTFNIIYNAYGLVKEIRDHNNVLVQSYHYDSRGNLLQKVLHNSNSALQKYATYISDVSGNVLAIYEQSGTLALALQPQEVPVYGAGRVAVYKPAANRYFYEVSDHLGNVRAVIGAPATLNYTANMETGLSGSGESVFNNYSSSTYDLVDHTDAGTTYQQVQLLNGGVSGRVGLAKSFSVSPGDKVKIEAYAKYRNLTGNANATSFVMGLASAFGVSSSSGGEQLKIYNGLNYYAGTVPEGDHLNDNEGAPKVFVTVLLFDKNYNLVDAGWDQIEASAEQASGTVKTPPLHDLLSRELTVTEPGYAYVFLSNEHPYYVDAYFDDVSVTHTQSPIVAGGDYYPFGLAMENREITDEPYRHGYQGQFSEKDLTTGMQEFELRTYDPRIGRWLSPDPYGQFSSPYLGMGNIPNVATDADGGFSSPCPPACGNVAFEVMGREVVGAVATRIPAQAISTAALAAGIQIAGNIPGHLKSSGLSYAVDDQRSGFYKFLEGTAVNINQLFHRASGGLIPEMPQARMPEYRLNVETSEKVDILLNLLAAWEGMRGGSPTPQLRTVPATPNGPVTQPTPVVPTTRATDIHGRLFVDDGGETVDKEDFRPARASDFEAAGITDVHAFKGAFVGKKHVSLYDVFVNRLNKELWIFRKGLQGEGIDTGYFVE